MSGGSDREGYIAIANDTNSKTTTTPTDCFANLRLNSNGSYFFNSVGSLDNYSASQGSWNGSILTTAEIWVEYTLTSGSLNNTDPGAGRLQLSTSRDFSVIENTAGQSQVAGLTLDFYDASAGGHLLKSTSFTLTANEDNP
jgi:hypothetical protein